MHSRTATVTATAALALATALTACSTTTPDEHTTPAVGSKPTAARESTAAANKPAGLLALGSPSSWAADGRSGSTTVLSYRQPVTGIEPPSSSGEADEDWGALEVKVCTKEGKVGVTQQPWSVAFGDGARVTTTGQSGGDFPRPEYPQEAIVKPGDCVRGLLMFPAPKGQRPERAIYAPEGMDPVEWQIPVK
ncbi:hypothetical protein M8I34_30120 [Streptomyces sp. MCA2]|uniref:hypothetical protein n=1 Tax=Streptomyces sp. MCA2 TaxID=2944805 RepID=UPI002021EB22|nr:hypothetical protein [Streptomyces sp. MCA2]MCL7495632.1 hypothetical protein [Streptomyces sp. MCA2]